MATLAANAGAYAFHDEISPLRDWRVAVVVCRAWPIAWYTTSVGNRRSVPSPGRHRGAEVGDVVDLMGVQRDPPGQVDLDLVGGRDRPHQVVPVTAGVLGHGQQSRDVVARVGVLGGQERVVEIELAHGNAVGPRRPFGRHPHLAAATEDSGTGCEQSAGEPGRGHLRPAGGEWQQRPRRRRRPAGSPPSLPHPPRPARSEANSASFQANCCSRGRASALLWARTSCSITGTYSRVPRWVPGAAGRATVVSRSGNQKWGCACSGSRRPRLRTLPRSVAPYRDSRRPGPQAASAGPDGPVTLRAW